MNVLRNAVTKWLGREGLWFWVLIMPAAGALRTIGLDFGKPLAIKADEEIIIYNIIYMFENRTFEPDTFQWPGHLLMQIGYFFVTVFSYLGLGLRPEEAVTSYPPEIWHPAVRLASALIGTAALIFAYLIGRFVSKRAAYFAALLVGFFPLLVEHSHYATVDIALSTSLLAVVYFCIHYLKNQGLRHLVFASVIGGLAVTIKYPGVLSAGLILVVVVSAAFTSRKLARFFSHGLFSLAIFAATIFLASPALFTNRHEVFRSIFNESKAIHPGADGLAFWDRFFFYLTSFASNSGLIILAMCIVGAYSILRNRRWELLPLFFGLGYWLAMSVLELHWVRWGLPIYIFLLVLAAVGGDHLISMLGNAKSKVAQVFPATLLVVAAVNLLFAGLNASASFTARDTRVIALDYFRDNGITQENSIYEGYTPFSAGTLAKVFDQFVMTDGRLEPLDQSKRFLILSSIMENRYDVATYPDESEFYIVANSQFAEVISFEPSFFPRKSTFEFQNIFYNVENLVALSSKPVRGPEIRVLTLQ